MTVTSFTSLYPILEESKDKKLHGISRGWYKNGPYVPAIDSFLVIIGGMEEHQHQNHVDSKERMLTNMIEFEGE